MVDLTPLKAWLNAENDVYNKSCAFTIGRIGFDNWFNDEIDVFCNCTKTFRNGGRCTQTNDYRYNVEISTVARMIEEFGGDNKDEYYTRLIKQHQTNLEFEAINGFDYEVYSNKKNKKSSTTKKRTKQTSMNIEDKEKKETAAERKLKAHAVKLNALTFKPKSVSNGDTL